MNIFDTHAHYDDKAFDEDRYELLDAMSKNNVKYIINQGTDVETSKFSISLAEKYSYIYAAVGIHPEEIYKEENIEDIRKLIPHEKIVAIGVAIVLFIIVRLALILLKFIAEAIAKLPIIKQCNKAGGLVYGAIRGMFVIYIFLAILFLVMSVNNSGTIAKMINSSIISKI